MRVHTGMCVFVRVCVLCACLCISVNVCVNASALIGDLSNMLYINVHPYYNFPYQHPYSVVLRLYVLSLDSVEVDFAFHPLMVD